MPRPTPATPATPASSRSPEMASASPSTCDLFRATAILSFNVVLTFLQGGFFSIVCPAEIAIFAPDQAALFNGLFMGLGAIINVFSPPVGYLADHFGRRPLLLLGALFVAIGEGLLLVGVYSRHVSYLGLWVFFLGFLLLQVGTVVLTTCFNALVADLAAQMPAKSGLLSSIFGLYSLVGAAMSFIVGGIVFPVSENEHNFYWFALVITGVAIVALVLSIPKEADERKRGRGTGSDAPPTRGCCSLACSTFSEWWNDVEYGPWRAVVLSRCLYFFSAGSWGAAAYYFLVDCTDAGSPKEAGKTMAYIAFISLASSLIAAYPSGLLSDRVGSVPCTVLSTTITGLIFVYYPFVDKTSMVLALIPLYGIAQQICE